MSLAAIDRTTQFLRIVGVLEAQRSITKQRKTFISRGAHITLDLTDVDVHCMDLGVFQSLVTHAMWQLIDDNVWDVGEMLTTEDLHHLSAVAIKLELDNSYTTTSRSGALRCICQMNFFIHTSGKRNTPVLRAKAVQRETSVEFTHHLLQEHYGCLRTVLLGFGVRPSHEVTGCASIRRHNRV